MLEEFIEGISSYLFKNSDAYSPILSFSFSLARFFRFGMKASQNSDIHEFILQSTSTLGLFNSASSISI